MLSHILALLLGAFGTYAVFGIGYSCYIGWRWGWIRLWWVKTPDMKYPTPTQELADYDYTQEVSAMGYRIYLLKDDRGFSYAVLAHKGYEDAWMSKRLFQGFLMAFLEGVVGENFPDLYADEPCKILSMEVIDHDNLDRVLK